MDRKINQFIDSIDASELDCSDDYNLELKQQLKSIFQSETKKAEVRGAEMLANRIHEHKPLFHTPDKCKLCNVVDGHLDILKRELQKTTAKKAEVRGNWWITNRDTTEENKKVAGPFTTSKDAGLAREILERYSGNVTYWIEELQAQATHKEGE